MPYCFVPKCQSGSARQRQFHKDHNLPKIHFFQPPSEEVRKEWERLIKRDDSGLVMTQKVCSLHFQEKDLILYDEFIVNGEVQRIPRQRAALKPGALPLLLQNYPSYYQPKLQGSRKPPVSRDFKSATAPVRNRKSVQEIIEEEVPTDNGAPPPTDAHECVLTTLEVPRKPEGPKEQEWSHLNVTSLELPIDWCICNTLDKDKKSVVHINPKNIQIDKSITFQGTSPPQIIFRGLKSFEGAFDKPLSNLKEAQKLLITIDSMKVCTGTGMASKPFSVHCNGPAVPRGKRCAACTSERERLRKQRARQEKVKKRLAEKKAKKKVIIQNLRRSKLKLIKKVLKYKRRINLVMEQCRATNAEVLENAIKNLPAKQQEAVRCCFEASKKKGPSGRRYTIEWVYECMLMRIRSRALYHHIKDQNILPLPCDSTIRGYLKNFSGAYGFNPSTMELLKEKSAELEPEKRRGVLLIDEVKLTPGAYFNQETLKCEGFHSIHDDNFESFGEEVTEDFEEAVKKLPGGDPRDSDKRKKKEEKNKNQRDKNLGDHGLVIMFQPFQGAWVQNLACFLTKDAANDDELTKLILEATILVEYSGFMVDGVITDGAPWNRSMWKKFGISEGNVAAEHPCDQERELFFISDFPHLLKCMRNCLVEKKIIETPEGKVKLAHWEAVVAADSLRELGLRECPRLSKEHLNPDTWAKQRCRLAWQFWSDSAAAGMESFRFQGVEALEDCDESVKMCHLINKLADVMNSRTPPSALRPNSKQLEVIDEFLAYLKSIGDFQTEKMRAAELKAEEKRLEFLKNKNTKNVRSRKADILKKRMYVFSESTDIGLKVSLEGMKRLLAFLCTKKGYKYLMTCRLNQDALERFFGLVRQSCGPNTHPESKMFAQLFRLLSIYSLVKPLKGSNITGGEMLTTLLNLDDLKRKTIEERKKELDKRLDEIIESGENYHLISDIANLIEDHDYCQESIDEFALVYVAGYTARKATKFTHGCEACLQQLKLRDERAATDEHLLIKLKSRGYLTYPSDDLIALLRHLEKHIVTTGKQHELEENILFLVVENLEKAADRIPLIGCQEHQQSMTKAITKFYIIMRMHFLCRRWNAATAAQKKLQRIQRKRAHQT